MGIGIFYDYKYAPFSGLKINFSFFPSWKTDDTLFNYTFKEIMLELSVLSKIMFNTPKYNFWIGVGPSFQYISSESINNYLMSFYVAVGSNIEYSEEIYIIPELYLGANLYLKNEKYKNMVQNITKTTDFFKNGFTITLKFGIGYKI